MARNQHLEDALYLWAAEERGGINHGYPKKVPFYMPPAGFRESPRFVTDLEYKNAGIVASGIAKLRTRSRRQVEALEWFYGARTDLPHEKGERIRQAIQKFSEQKFYSEVRKARTYLEGYLDSHAGAKA